MNDPNNQEPNNEQVWLENTLAAAALADLPLTDAQAEAAKGGDGNTTTAGQFPWQVSLRSA